MSDYQRPRRSVRRALSAAASGALVLALLPGGPAVADQHDEPRGVGYVCQEPYEAEFDDLSEDNTHFESIVCAADYEIARGHTDGTYRPSNSVRRDQMASFIVRLIETASGEELEEGDEDFEDVPEDNEHHDNIGKLANIDVVEGFEDGTYRPRESVTRDQMASFIRRAIAYLDNENARDDSAPPAGEEQFGDVGRTSPHYDAVNALGAQAIVVGDGEGSYDPRDDVRRDQMASFLMRGYDYAAEARLVEAPGPAVMQAGTLFADRIQVGFDDGVTVRDAEGFHVYSDETCDTEFAHGVAADGGGPIVDVELSEAMTSEDDYWVAVDGRTVENGDGYPNVPSECLELSGQPINGDDGGDGENGEDGEDPGPQPQDAGAFSDTEIGVLFDSTVTVNNVEGFTVHTDDACTEQIAHGTEVVMGDGFAGLRIALSDEMTGEEGHWLLVEAGTVEDSDENPNTESDCLEIRNS